MSPDMGKPFDPGFNARRRRAQLRRARWKPLEIGAMVARLRALLADRPRHPRLEVLAEEERLSGRSLQLRPREMGERCELELCRPGGRLRCAELAQRWLRLQRQSRLRRMARGRTRPSRRRAPQAGRGRARIRRIPRTICAARATARNSTASCRSGVGGRARPRSDRADPIPRSHEGARCGALSF